MSAVQVYHRRILHWGAALLLAGLAAWFSVRNIQWEKVGAALAHPHWFLLGAALATVLATTGAKAIRWLVLLRHSRTQALPGRVLRVLLIGQMGNSFLPARIGDVGRAVLLGPESAGGIAAVLGTLVVEKALDGVLGLFVLAGLALWTPLPGWLRQPLFGLTVLTGILLGVLILAAMRQAWAERTVRLLTRTLPVSLRGRADTLLLNFGQGMGLLHAPGDAILALLWSAVLWGLGALTNLVTFAALDIEAPTWSIWLVLVTGYVANFLPAIPGQVGVFEYACVLALTATGVGGEPALAFGIVLHLLVYGPPAVLGPASMLVEGLSWSKLRQAQAESMRQHGSTV